MSEKKEFEILFQGTGRASGKMRNDIAVEWPAMGERFDLATDEGPFHGGDSTAPPPLALFTAGLTGCLMTQIRAFAKRLKIELSDVTVNLTCRWKGEQEGDGPYVSSPIGFHFDVEIESPAPVDAQRRLLDAAKKGCFLEATLGRSNTVTHRLKTPDGWIDA